MDLGNIQPALGDIFYIVLATLGIALGFFLFALWRTGWGRRRGDAPRPISLRTIPAYDATQVGLAQAAETGRAVHASPGSGGVGARGITTASTLAGLSLVESMARVSAITGAPVEATTNDAVAYALTDNALRRGYARAGWTMEQESGAARFLTHRDPLAYAAGAAEVAAQNKVSQAVMAGEFGPEVLLITEAQRRAGAHQIAGAADPQAVALLALTADHTLIGEEIFASGAYLEQRKSHLASLLAQDGLRWVAIIFIIGGFLLLNYLGYRWDQLLTLFP